MPAQTMSPLCSPFPVQRVEDDDSKDDRTVGTSSTREMSDDLIVDFPQAPRLTQQRRVSFSPQIELKYVKNLALEVHKSELWFTDRDVKLFKVRMASTLKAISSTMTMAQYAELNSNNTSAFLGLENYLSSTTPREIFRRRRAVATAVLAEHQRQSDEGMCDPAAIARVSEAESEVSRRRARLIGLLHADK